MSQPTEIGATVIARVPVTDRKTLVLSVTGKYRDADGIEYTWEELVDPEVLTQGYGV